MPNVIDLFAGAGGLSLGATRAGFNVVAAVEIEPHAILTHQANFPNARHIQADISSISGEALLQQSGIQRNDLTGIIGGPPCQGFSSIGHGDVDDTRNQLFVKFFQLVRDLQPAFFVAENVPGIMNAKYDRIRETAFNNVNNYTILPPLVVNASDYGAPTIRTRIFFIGFRLDAPIEPFAVGDIENMKVAQHDKTNVRQALEGIPSRIRFSAHPSGEKKIDDIYFNATNERLQSDFFYSRVVGHIPDGVGNQTYINRYNEKHIVNGCLPTKHSSKVKYRYSRLNYGQQDKISKSTRLNPDNFCPTLRAGTGPEKGSYQAVRPIHYNHPRVITPREAARLQGFPDWFMLPETIWHGFRQIGNSVSPIAAEQIFRAIYQKLT